jgi:CelD/BcsL family acetyltransferase involved in cellulose biosynthesis
MTVAWVEVSDRAEPLLEEWEDLAERTRAAPFVRPGWIWAWRSAFGRGALRILVVRRSGQLVGLVPLERRGRALRSPTNAHTPAFDFLALDDEVARALAQAIFAAGATIVVVERLDADGDGLAALRIAAQEAGYRELTLPLARSPYVRGERSLAQHERSLSRNLRHDVDRRLRRLCELGAVSVHVADGREHLDELLEEGFEVERLGWKGAAGTAITSQEQTRRFYADVARWAASTGSLRLAFLRLDGSTIAFQFDLETDETYYSLKIGYDPEYERFSPGKLLAYTMVSRAVSFGLGTYELLGKEEPWKHRWTDTSRERVAFHAFARSPAGFLSWSTMAHARPLARRVPLAARLAAAMRR